MIKQQLLKLLFDFRAEVSTWLKEGSIKFIEHGVGWYSGEKLTGFERKE